jgi:hypothetical protein
MRFIKALPIAVLAGALTLGAPSRAHATMELLLQEDGGAITVVATGPSLGSLVFNGVYKDFTVNFLGATTDNGANLSDLLSSTTKVTLNVAGTHTLTLMTTSQDYNLPTGPQLDVTSSIGGTYNTGAGSNVTFQAFADKNNTLNGMSDFTNGLMGVSPSPSTGAPNVSFSSPTAEGVFTRLSTNYSVSSLTNVTLVGAGSSLNYSNSVSMTEAVPGPAGLVVALTGLPCLAIGWLRRRRKRA